jgi:hypothetical protein
VNPASRFAQRALSVFLSFAQFPYNSSSVDEVYRWLSDHGQGCAPFQMPPGILRPDARYGSCFIELLAGFGCASFSLARFAGRCIRRCCCGILLTLRSARSFQCRLIPWD